MIVSPTFSAANLFSTIVKSAVIANFPGVALTATSPPAFFTMSIFWYYTLVAGRQCLIISHIWTWFMIVSPTFSAANLFSTIVKSAVIANFPGVALTATSPPAFFTMSIGFGTGEKNFRQVIVLPQSSSECFSINWCDVEIRLPCDQSICNVHINLIQSRTWTTNQRSVKSRSKSINIVFSQSIAASS